MFEPEDFKLSMEKELTLIKIKNEIKECEDVEVLRNSLIQTAESLMQHQQLLAKTLKTRITDSMKKIFE